MSKSSRRYPGVRKLADGRVKIRWTKQADGRRKDYEETLPAMTMGQASAVRASRIEGLSHKTMTYPILGAYAQLWLTTKAPRMKRSAAESYATALTDHVLPVLGGMRADQITRADVDRWIVFAEARLKLGKDESGRVVRNGALYSRDTVLGWWAKVKQLLADVWADHRLDPADLPTRRVPPPKCYGRKRVLEQRTLTGPQLLELFDALPAGWLAETYVAAMTGVRAGELYAMRIDRVDWGAEKIEVSSSHYHGTEGTTKTGVIRYVPIPGRVAVVVRAHIRRMMMDQHPGLTSGLLFPGSEQGKHGNWMRYASSLRNQLVRTSKRAQLPFPVTGRILRRTFNTLAVDNGIDRLVLRHITGHSSEAMTDLYYGVKDDQITAAARLVADQVHGTDVGQVPHSPIAESEEV
jgi:integrase